MTGSRTLSFIIALFVPVTLVLLTEHNALGKGPSPELGGYHPGRAR